MIDTAGELERIREYIRGGLSEDERRMLEERLVRDPEFVREVEQSLRLREGLEQLRSDGYFAESLSEASREPRAEALRVWLPALAAAAIAALAFVLWLPSLTESAPVLAGSSEAHFAAGVTPQVTARFTFVPMRDSSTPDLNLPSHGLIEFRATPGTRVAGSRYRVALVRDDPGGSPKPAGTVAGVALSADGYVHSYADASRLSAGAYTLRIEADPGASGTAETFRFNLHAGAEGR